MPHSEGALLGDRLAHHLTFPGPMPPFPIASPHPPGDFRAPLAASPCPPRPPALKSHPPHLSSPQLTQLYPPGRISRDWGSTLAFNHNWGPVQPDRDDRYPLPMTVAMRADGDCRVLPHIMSGPSIIGNDLFTEGLPDPHENSRIAPTDLCAVVLSPRITFGIPAILLPP